jgi:hypothetical protein
VLATDTTPNNSIGAVTQAINAEVREFTYDPAAVSLQSPANGDSVTVPTLRWSPVSGAAQYRVTIAPVDAAGSGVPVATTAATSFTPRVALKPGTYRWQVQTVSEDNRVGAGTVLITQRLFTVEESEAPTADSPQPTLPESSTRRFPTLTWTPVVDATRYIVRLRRAGTPAWNATTITTVQPATEDWGTAYLSPDQYEWQVEAWNGNTFLSQGSVGRFTIAPVGRPTGHQVALTGTGLDNPSAYCEASPPADCQNLRQTPVLRWDPIANAGSYKLYVSRDAELTNLVQGYPTTVHGTVWTPSTSFADSNAGSAYYWLVVPCTASSSCAPVEAADRQFNLLSNPVTLVSPVGGVTRSDDITLSWQDYLDSASLGDQSNSSLPTPARTEAKYYRVQTSTTPQFTTTLDNQLVDQTTYTSFANTYPEGPIYWRVQAYDGSNNPLTWSDTGTFEKRSPVPVATSPLAGEVFQQHQHLAWAPLAFAASYNVEVYKNDDTVPSSGNRVVNVTTKQTAFSPTSVLPASAPNYRWRVQRVDAKNRVGAWSELLPFKVAGAAPVQQTPGDGVRQDPNGALFEWSSVDRATSYRFERRPIGSVGLAETRVTPALGWAPQTAVSGGNHEWRVVALDSGGDELGASGWRGFTVIDRPATTAPQITGSGQVGTVLTSTQPSWNLPDVNTTYQWYRGSTAIAGATENIYELTPADLNQSIKVRVTGTKAGFPAGTADSNVIKCGLGAMPTLTEPLVLQGPGRTGTVLSAEPTWNEAGIATTYQWLVGGAAVSGATNNSFTLRTTDVGKAVQLRVTGSRTGYSPGVYTSNAVTATGPERLVPTSTAKVSGITRVGQYLTANPGTWPSGVTVSYRWLRNGVAISGATNSTYRLALADAGRRISVRVTARKADYLDGTSTSGSLLISKLASRTTFSLADRTIRWTTYPRAYVRVTAPTGSVITGTLSVYDGSRRIKYVSLGSAAKGRITITVPRLRRGLHYLSVSYGGNTQLLGSKSGRLSIRVS